MSEQASIEVTPGLHGNVKVSVEVGRECLVFVWKMAVEEAIREAEEIARRLSR